MKRASGGKVSGGIGKKGTAYAGAGSKTLEEAKSKKCGGSVKRASGGRVGSKSPFSAAHIKTNGDA